MSVGALSIVHGCACCAFGAVKGTAAPFYDDNCIVLYAGPELFVKAWIVCVFMLVPVLSALLLVQVLALLLKVGPKTLANAQEPEAVLWALINNQVTMLTQPLPLKVQVGAPPASELGYV